MVPGPGVDLIVLALLQPVHRVFLRLPWRLRQFRPLLVVLTPVRREDRVPRVDWPAKVEDLGFHFHSIDGVYWDERACYRFTSAQVDKLELATGELQSRCIDAATKVIESGDYGRFHIPEAFIPLIEQSWNDDEKSLFGRFDLSWDGTGEPKMLEYNADTPTALLEASVVQWYWLQDVLPGRDQFNSIHERLIDRWKQMAADLPADRIVRPSRWAPNSSRTSHSQG